MSQQLHSTHVGIIGLGRMGSAIAKRLASEGFPVSGWTRSGISPQKADDLGIAAHASMDALVDVSDIIILSLIDDAAVRSVLDLLCQANISSKLIVDTSTVSPNTIRAGIEQIQKAGASAIDAPISGGPEMVANGVAGIYIGGEAIHADRFMPAAKVLSNRIVHVGGLGDGVTAKIVNNMMLVGYWQSLKEALLLGKKAGLDAETMLQILAKSPSANAILPPKIPVILGESDAVSFSVSGIVKDLTLFTDTARQLGVSTPALVAGLESYTAHLEAGHGDADLATMLHAAYENG